MFVQTEITPNPNSLKFIPGKTVSKVGSFEISSKDQTDNELLRNLLSINGIRGIFLGQDFLSIIKKENIKWEDIKHIIISFINEFYSNGNEFVIFSEYSEFKTEEPSIINMKNVSCFFYFKDGTILEIRSKKGIYNNVTLDMSFEENVNMFYMDNSLVSDKADFSNENNNLIIEGNVTTQSQKGELMADKLNFDFSDKKLKASMYNEDRVNIKTSF